MAVPTVKMNTGAQIPVVGFGTWQLRPKQAYDSVAEALKLGYRLIDTARIYENEEDVGRAVKDSGIDRSQIIVTTKLWNSDQGYDSAFEAFNQSLRRLGLEYIDIYLIHWPGSNPAKRLASWQALGELYKQGKVKAVGVSNFTIDHLKEVMDKSDVVPAINQIEFHPFIYDDQKDLLEFCQKKRIVFEAYSPLAQGHLSDELLLQIGKKYGKSASQVMLRWAVQQGTVPLPRSSSTEHIKENFDIFDFELSDNDMAQIHKLSSGDRQSWNPTNLP